MAGPTNEIKRPILMTRSSSVRRRTPIALAGLLVLANVVAVAAFLDRPQSESRRQLARQTPTWRVETGWEAPERTATATTDELPGLPVAVRTNPAEIVTPEQIRAANRSPCSPPSDSWVDVRRLGAKGNGKADDTAAIQAANDAVAKRGGGRVIFPPGIYRAIGVRQDSCVLFEGSPGASLLHPDGTSPLSIVEGRVLTTTGSIARNSRVLRTTPTPRLRPGALVAIQAAGGRSPVQRTKLRSDVAPQATTVFVRDTTGLQRNLRNHLYLEHEVISYLGISGNMLLNVERGLFGTKPVRHPAGSLVTQAMRLKAVVVRMSGNRITLDRHSAFRVENANVSVGSVGMEIRGLTLNGNRRPRGAEGVATTSVRYELARWVTIRNSRFERGPHGGVALDKGTSDSLIEDSDFVDNGDTVNTSGAAIWLFRGPEKNVVRRNRIAGQTYAGIVVDDRSVSSTEFDAYGAANEVSGNTIDIARFPPHRNAGVVIDGSHGCHVLHNTIHNSATGVIVSRVTQGTRPSIAQGNVVLGNSLVGHRMGIDVSGSDNQFVRNDIRSSQHAWKDTGVRNRFVDNDVQS